MSQRTNNQTVNGFLYPDKSGVAAIENAVREIGRLEESKRLNLEGKG